MGLEFFIWKVTEPLQSCCFPVQKNLPRKAELAWQVSRYLWRGSVDFKLKSRPFFTIISKLRNCNSRTWDLSPLIERVLADVMCDWNQKMFLFCFTNILNQAFACLTQLTLRFLYIIVFSDPRCGCRRGVTRRRPVATGRPAGSKKCRFFIHFGKEIELPAQTRNLTASWYPHTTIFPYKMLHHMLQHNTWP